MQKIEWMNELKIGDEVVEVYRKENSIGVVTGISKKSIFIGSNQYSKFTSYDSNIPKSKVMTNCGYLVPKLGYRHVAPISDEIKAELQKEREQLMEKIKSVDLNHVPTRELKWIADRLNSYQVARGIISSFKKEK